MCLGMEMYLLFFFFFKLFSHLINPDLYLQYQLSVILVSHCWGNQYEWGCFSFLFSIFVLSVFRETHCFDLKWLCCITVWKRNKQWCWKLLQNAIREEMLIEHAAHLWVLRQLIKCSACFRPVDGREWLRGMFYKQFIHFIYYHV